MWSFSYPELYWVNFPDGVGRERYIEENAFGLENL